MALQPIFPPIERNFSAAELEQAATILDDETKEVLAADRARLLQGTAASAISFSKLVGMPPSVALEIAEAVTRSARDLSPSYHAYLNKLLSALTELSAEGKSVPVVTEVEIRAVTGEAEQLPDDDIPEYAGPVISLPAETQLYPHDDRTTKQMLRFLRDVVSESTYEVEKLTHDEASLLTWQILDLYRRFQTRGIRDGRKVIHIERIATHVGLYGPPKTLQQMGAQSGEAGSASIGSTIGTAKNYIREIIDPNVRNMIARARKTLNEVDGNILFMDSDTVALLAAHVQVEPEAEPEEDVDEVDLAEERDETPQLDEELILERTSIGCLTDEPDSFGGRDS